MMPLKSFLEPLRVRRVRIRAIKPTFVLNEHRAEVGEEGELDHNDALTLVKQGKVEILGEAPPRTIPARDLADPPPLRPMR